MVWKGNPNGDHLAPCLVALIDEIDQRSPGRNKTSDGSIGDRAHRNRKSDHNPDHNGIVRALDLTDDPGDLHGAYIDHDDFDPDVLAEQWIANRDPRIKYLISDGRICTSYSSSKGPAWRWRKYTGTNAHKKHLHISTLASGDNDTRPWLPAGPTTEDDDMCDYVTLVQLAYAEAKNPDLKGQSYWIRQLRAHAKGPDFVIDELRRTLKLPPIAS